MPTFLEVPAAPFGLSTIPKGLHGQREGTHGLGSGERPGCKVSWSWGDGCRHTWQVWPRDPTSPALHVLPWTGDPAAGVLREAKALPRFGTRAAQGVKKGLVD